MKIIFVSVLAIVMVAASLLAADVTRGRMLRHVVLLKFKEGTSDVEIKKVEEAFRDLKKKIPEIVSLEWGTNNSPEKLDRGFTHCFVLTFKSEQARAVYLPHPDHKAFGSVLRPVMADVLVIDYWSKE